MEDIDHKFPIMLINEFTIGRKRLRLNNGHEISVQASALHSSAPRENHYSLTDYSHVEVAIFNKYGDYICLSLKDFPTISFFPIEELDDLIKMVGSW